MRQATITAIDFAIEERGAKLLSISCAGLRTTATVRGWDTTVASEVFIARVFIARRGHGCQRGIHSARAPSVCGYLFREGAASAGLFTPRSMFFTLFFDHEMTTAVVRIAWAVSGSEKSYS